MDRDLEPKTKEVDGEEWPASDFAYVPDPEKPSTWKLPIFNMHHVGGALAAMTTMDDYKDLRQAIGLDENSKVLLFSTEGDTDPDRYKNIVWEGKEK